MLNWFKKLSFKKEETPSPENEVSLKVLTMDIVEFDAEELTEYLTNQIRILEETVMQYERSHEDDQVITKVMDQEIISLEKSLKEKDIKLQDKDHQIEQLKKFYDYFLELYGSGLEVNNWSHRNQNPVMFDEFFDNAKEQMDFIPPSNQQ